MEVYRLKVSESLLTLTSLTLKLPKAVLIAAGLAYGGILTEVG